MGANKTKDHSKVCLSVDKEFFDCVVSIVFLIPVIVSILKYVNVYVFRINVWTILKSSKSSLVNIVSQIKGSPNPVLNSFTLQMIVHN